MVSDQLLIILVPYSLDYSKFQYDRNAFLFILFILENTNDPFF